MAFYAFTIRLANLTTFLLILVEVITRVSFIKIDVISLSYDP